MLKVVEMLMYKHLLYWNSNFCIFLNLSIPLSKHSSPQNSKREVEDIIVNAVRCCKDPLWMYQNTTTPVTNETKLRMKQLQ
jgi:hypothetical protein